MTKSKIQNKPNGSTALTIGAERIRGAKIQILKLNFVICALIFGFFSSAYALNLDTLKFYFLQGDYKQAIFEGEKLISSANHSQGTDELYYILALSYIKDGNYLRASDIFEIILKEFSRSPFRQEARLGLADTHLLKGDLTAAESQYKSILAKNPNSKFEAQIYYRLSQIGFKQGNIREGRGYLEKLKSEFPLNIELAANNDIFNILSKPEELYYSVQVGSFEGVDNARKLRDKLIACGYYAFVEETIDAGTKMYRVKVGKAKTRSEASRLETKLSREGYPTKICP